MAEGKIYITVECDIDTGDDTPMETVIEKLNAGTGAVLSHEVVMIESPEGFDLYNPKVVEVADEECNCQ